MDRHKKSINNFHDLAHIMKILMDPNIEVEYKNSIVAILGGVSAAFFAFIIAVILQLNIHLTILSFVVFIQNPLIYLALGVLINETDGFYSRYIISILFGLELPLIYCFSGGMNGPGLLWFMFSYILFAVIFSERISRVLIVLDAIIVIATIIVTEKYPALLFEIDQEKAKINTLLCALVISISIANIILQQKRIAFAQQRHLEQISSELEDMNNDLLDTTKRLNDSLEENIQALERQRRFTAMLNHELRNPLNGIMGYLQLQLMNDHIPEQFKTGMRDAFSLTGFMLQTVNDVLDYSKMQEGKFEITKTDFGLNDVLNNIHAIFDYQTSQKGLELIYDIPSENYNIYADGIRIQQIISNLLSNSVKYTKQGTVRLGVSVEQNNLCLTIADTGKGMTKEELEYIYEPYQRFDLQDNSKIQGTGLGMSIVRNLVEALEGSIRIESEVNKGTTFYVELPIEIKGVYHASETEVTSQGIDLSEKIILVADDDAVNLKVIEMYLKKNNATVITAKNGYEALSIIRSGKCRVDMLITDNMMPEMTGCDLKNKMNEMGIEIPSVILTGSNDDDSVKKFLQIGFASVLAKPITQTTLISSVANVLEM